MFPSTISNGTFSPLRPAPPPPPPPPSAPPQPPEIVSMVPLSSNDDDHALLDPIIPTPSANIPIKTSTDGKNGPEVDSKLSPHSLVPWSAGLCCCCQDPSACCLTCCCPCITFGRIAEIADRGSTSCGVSGGIYTLILLMTGCPCLYSCFYRSKLRGQYFLEEKPCCDCCVHCCFEPCALCQEYRQLKNLGFEMSIGWHGNMERRKRGANTVPPSVKLT